MCTHARPPPSAIVPSLQRNDETMDTGNQVRLADFGFAKVLEEGEDGMTGLCGTKVGNSSAVPQRRQAFSQLCLKPIVMVRAVNYTFDAGQLSFSSVNCCRCPSFCLALGFSALGLNKKLIRAVCCWFSSIRCAQPYLSPEQVGGLRYGFSSDLWSAGVVIYELLHGRTAFW